MLLLLAYVVTLTAQVCLKREMESSYSAAYLYPVPVHQKLVKHYGLQGASTQSCKLTEHLSTDLPHR